MVTNIESNCSTNDCFAYMTQLPEDAISEIVMKCMIGEHPKSVVALARTNNYFYEQILGSNREGKLFRMCLDLKQLCPKLTILDAKALGLVVGDEPPVNRLKVFMAYCDLIPHVQNGTGVTLLTISKGLTTERLLTVINNNMGVLIDPRISAQELEGNAIENTYRILISEDIILASCDEGYDEQCHLLLKMRCGVPTMKENVALYVFKKTMDPEYKIGDGAVHVRTATSSSSLNGGLLTMWATNMGCLYFSSNTLEPDHSIGVCARRRL